MRIPMSAIFDAQQARPQRNETGNTRPSNELLVMKNPGQTGTGAKSYWVVVSNPPIQAECSAGVNRAALVRSSYLE
jgi:hypothetical protein